MEKTTTLTVADILAALPRITLDPAEAVEMGRRAFGFLAAGDLDLTEASIALFATREMLASALLAFLADEARGGRLNTLRAVAA
jgi:hypothetical protein